MANIYKGAFVNTQVDYSDNSPNEQTIYVTITDIGSTELPYGLNYWVDTSIGDGDQLMNVSWSSLPTCDELVIGYRLEGAVDWTDITLSNPDPSGFYQWIVPFGSYEIRFRIIIGATETIYYDFPPTEIELEMADNPVVFKTIDNSEDKFTTIKSKSATIRVHTNDDVNAMVFAGGGDNQYKVQIAVNNEADVIFTGWLSISDLGQTFQPDPNVLVLIATDGIAFIKNIPLSDNENRFITGPHPLIKYISWALQKTGLELDIWVQMNLLEVNSIYDYPEYHFYNTVYLNAQTFETNIGELDDCYTILQKILGEFCELSQQKNVWFIKSIDEADYPVMRICRFDYKGTPIDYVEPDYTKLIGASETMAFMNDDARLSLQRPYKAVKHKFNYNYPAEIVQNIDFQRGDVITAPDMSAASSTGVYETEGWTHYKAILDPPQIDYVARILKTFEYGYIKDTMLELSQPSPIGATLYVNNVRSTPFYVRAGDILKINIDVRTSASINYFNPIQVRLVPDVGANVYDWRMDNRTLNAAGDPVTNEWASFNPMAFAWATWTINNTPGEVNSTSAEIIIPYDGVIYVRLLNANYQISTLYYSSDTWFTSLGIELIPKINGTYQRLVGQEHISEQEVDTIAERNETVYMTDAPRIEMKGCIMRTLLDDVIYSGNALFDDNSNATFDGFLTPYMSINDYIRITGSTNNNGKFRIVDISYSITLDKTSVTFDEATISESATIQIDNYRYLLTDNFYDSITYPGGGVPQSDQLPYGQHQNQAVWNQYNRVFSAFEATIDGLDTDTVDSFGLPNLPDLLHCYYQTDAHPATNNKQFKVLHYEQDTDNCEWGLYMIEVGDSNIAKVYTGHSFKYVQR